MLELDRERVESIAERTGNDTLSNLRMVSNVTGTLYS